MTSNSVYKASGVDLEAERKFSAFAGLAMQGTYENSPFLKVNLRGAEGFRRLRTVDFRLPPGAELTFVSDGVGTKVGIDQAAATYRQTGNNLVAMNSGDITRHGCKPVFHMNVLDTSALGKPGSESFRCAQDLIRGLVAALGEVQSVSTGGETAELGIFVGSEVEDAVLKFNWSGFMAGIWHERAEITGQDILPGHDIVAHFDEVGSNGFSAFRRAFRTKFKGEWWKNEEAMPWIHRAAAPCRLFDSFLCRVNGWDSADFAGRLPVSGLAHISGGGIGEKFGDLLFPTGHSAELFDLFEPDPVMRVAADWLNEVATCEEERVDDPKFLSTWHGGQRLLSVMHPDITPLYMATAQAFGHPTKKCGKVVESKGAPKIMVTSKYQGKTFPIYAK